MAKGIGTGSLLAWQQEQLGGAYKTERDRLVRCPPDPTNDDSPLYNAIHREKRYSQGGLHERLKQAAQDEQQQRDVYSCFIGRQTGGGR